MEPCAGTNTIAALLAGAIDGAAAGRLERHLDACAVCRELVAALGRGLTAVGAAASGAAASGALPQVGERIGRYEIRRVIGAGGMGVVYEARDATLGRRVAIKLLRPDLADGDATQLLAEAQAMARLSHPNVAVVHDVGRARGQLYLCMEYVAGTTLREWLAVERPGWRAVLAVFRAAARGLAYVHAAGLMHLDVKPDNILVCRDGRVVVTDFGVARMVGGGGRCVVGTPAYMAPEQRRGEAADARADQYGWCAAFADALVGARPGAGGAGERASAVRDAAAPRWLRAILRRGLAADRARRYATMDALLAAIDAAERGVARRRRAAVGVGVAAAAAAAMSVAPRGGAATITQTRTIERPVVQRHVIQAAVPGTPPGARPASATGERDTVTATPPSAAPADAIRSPAIAAPDVAPAFAAIAAPAPWDPRAPGPMPPSSLAAADPATGGGAGGLAAAASTFDCDDGSERRCAIDPPACPGGTILAVQAGCWTCADETCASLGWPRTCNDGTRLTCTSEPPACAAPRVLAVRDGCWRCDDPFHCASRTPAPRPPRPPPPEACGNGRCDPGENRASCAADCPTTCGNGFCEGGEDHATCASDCCELGESGACAAVCGNGFCEIGEDHAGCAADCCELAPSGSCVPVCGNGFCEIGEDAASCPSECPP